MPIAFLMACGGEETADEAAENESTVDTQEEEAIEENVVDDEELYMPENEDGQWQINDYAEMFAGGKIYNSTDEMPEDEIGMHSYYQKLDIAGGYASVTGAYEGWSEYVLWRMADGRDLLGTMSAGCGPACSYTFNFYICEQEKTKKVNMQEMFPMDEMHEHRDMMREKALEKWELDYPEDFAYIYKFPQKGTSMQVDMMLGADEIHVPILKLSWNKEKFSIEELYTDLNPSHEL